MAPKIAALTIQSREDADDDGSDSIYNHPAIMFLGLLLLCFCIMAPMFWMLWMMRNDNRESESLFHSQKKGQHCVADTKQM